MNYHLKVLILLLFGSLRFYFYNFSLSSSWSVLLLCIASNWYFAAWKLVFDTGHLKFIILLNLSYGLVLLMILHNWNWLCLVPAWVYPLLASSFNVFLLLPQQVQTRICFIISKFIIINSDLIIFQLVLINLIDNVYLIRCLLFIMLVISLGWISVALLKVIGILWIISPAQSWIRVNTLSRAPW